MVSVGSYNDWKGWTFDSFGKFDHTLAAYFSAELLASGCDGLVGTRVLEIGFGNGAFAAWATDSKAIYLGTEAIPELVARGRRGGFEVYPALTALDSIVQPGSLDIVVAFDVFEHIERESLSRMLMVVRGLLKTGGRIIARVPSGDSPFARAIQHGDLTHRLVLGSSAIRQLAQEGGYSVLSVRQPAFPVFGLGIRAYLRRSAILVARSVVYPFVTQALMGGGEPVLTPNLVFVLGKP